MAQNPRAPYGLISNTPGGARAPGSNGPAPTPSEGSETPNDGRSSPTTAPGITGSAYGEPVDITWPAHNRPHRTKQIGVPVHAGCTGVAGANDDSAS